MALVRKFRQISSVGALLFAAALLCSCGINGVPSNPDTSDSETADTLVIDQYVGADVDSVNMINITDSDSPDGCHEWHVQLSMDDLDPEQPAGTAWYAPICQTDDDETPIPLNVVKLSAAQLTDFRAMLDQVQINTWDSWLEANSTLPSDESTVASSYMVSVLVNNNQGTYYDPISLFDTMPPNWNVFYQAMNTITGNVSG